MNANLRHILECIKCAREAADSRTDVQSKLDDYIGYLNKQINFLMERPKLLMNHLVLILNNIISL